LTRTRRKSEARIEAATPADFPTVKNLVPYYIYDLSEHLGWSCNAEGRYDGCDDLPDYWEKEDHHPFLIRAGNEIAGFAMVRPYPDEPDRMEIGEFFVLRKFKRRGIGREAAYRLFDRFQGEWLVRVLDENTGALCFWEAVIDEYTQDDHQRCSETYECPHSGTWPMQFFRFRCRLSPLSRST